MSETNEAEPQQHYPIAVAGEVVVSPAQARAEAVADALRPGYEKASTLVLTKEESLALQADFPDDAVRRGAGGDQNLLYISHPYLRERLNQVLGIGAAVPIRRREWAENFTTGKNKEGVRIYVEMVLMVRGCVVGEAVGDGTYYQNDRTNYSDALESAKSIAFTRCCKEFGVGLQMWKKEWVEGWKRRNSGQGAQQQAPQQNGYHDEVGPEPQMESEAYSKEFVAYSTSAMMNWKTRLARAGLTKAERAGIGQEIKAEYAKLTDYHQQEITDLYTRLKSAPQESPA